MADPIALPGREPFSLELSTQLRRALESKGDAYTPRTRHLETDGRPRFMNRLILETSPYLLQHAHNPVDWRPWSKEAFAEAARLDRPVLLSVGYSTCHWCHVMERESFEDEEIAAYLNANYVAIKVDREERPDVDSVYMTAVQLMRGGGGWPMTVVLLPDRRPYFAGTYFPARDGDRGVSIGFLTVLQRLKEAYVHDKERVLESASQVSRAVAKAARPSPPRGMPVTDDLVEAARFLVSRYDPRYGGFGGAPKFPRPATYGLLLRYARRASDPVPADVVFHSLRAMADGGIHDHVGGGFARYSTDDAWLVPHFEKMLYDNAQLLSLYVEAYQSSGDARFAEVVRDIADYVMSDMTSPSGGFYSATDADSEGVEGKFFVWSENEIDAILGKDRSSPFKAFFGVTAEGNFEGANILHRTESLTAFAKRWGRSPDDVGSELAADLLRLRAVRAQRVPPLKDDKILTEWNGQMIGALAQAGYVLDEARYVEAAQRAAEFIRTSMTHEGRLQRVFREGRPGHTAVLEDYAFVIAGYLSLFEVTSDGKWLTAAQEHQAVLDDAFWDDEAGGYFGTADDAEQLLVREKPSYDGAQPAGNSVAALNLLRLSTLTGEDAYRERAEKTLLAFSDLLHRGAIENPKMAQALDFYLDEALQVVVVVGTVTAPGLDDVLRKSFVPNKVLVRVEDVRVDALAEKLTLVEGKRAREGRTTVYVCRDRVCDQPVTEPAALQEQLSRFVPIAAPRLKTRDR